MSEAKESIGHDLYELQDVAEKVLSDLNSSETEKAAAKIIYLLSRDVSVELYGSTGFQSNETASFSVVVQPLKMMEEVTSSLAGIREYGKLSELLDTMRNTLESLVSTYGNPSQSINLLTNTGEPSESSSTRTTGREAMILAASERSFSKSRDVSSGESDGLDIAEPPVDEPSITQTEPQNNDSGTIICSGTTILDTRAREAVRYEVWELAEVIPSYEPGGFSRQSIRWWRRSSPWRWVKGIPMHSKCTARSPETDRIVGVRDCMTSNCRTRYPAFP